MFQICSLSTANDLELKRTSTLAKLNSMKSSLLSIDCGVQKSFHDIVNFKERLTNLKVESAIENTSYNSCANQKDYNNEQMMSLQNALTCKQSEIDQVLAEKKAMAIQIESLEVLLVIIVKYNIQIHYYYKLYKTNILGKAEKGNEFTH